MVHAVKNKVNAFAPFRGRMKVKNKAVQQVFRGGPDKQPNAKIKGKASHPNTVVKRFEAEKENHGDVDEQGNGKMHFGQCFHPGWFKHPDRFLAV